MGTEPVTFKVCDVGASKHYNSIILEKIGVHYFINQTLSYMSPEMLRSQVGDVFKSDVFSLGLVFLHMFMNIKFKKEDRAVWTDQEFQN